MMESPVPLLTAFLLIQGAAAPLAVTPAVPATPKVSETPKAIEPVCIRAGDLPPEFARWNATPAKTLTIGAPFIVTGKDAAAVKWTIPAPADKPGKGAVVAFRVAKAGTYRIGLNNGPWIDVVSRGKALESVAHGHGPACTGLRKIVDFTLKPGAYVLQFAGMPADTSKVMIVARPAAAK